jgi:protoheme IX farnesyltransferase
VSTLVGAVPGAMPPVIGYTAATGSIYGASSILGAGSILLFTIMFLWQLPHFLAIAWMYREDYARAGIPVLPVVEPDGGSTFRQMFLGCAALLPVGLMPSIYGIAGPIYFAGALICGSVFLAFAIATVKTQSTKWARLTFFASLIYLPVVKERRSVSDRRCIDTALRRCAAFAHVPL